MAGVGVFLKRLGYGAAGLGAWAGLGAYVEYATEGDWQASKQRRLQKEVEALRAQLESTRASRVEDEARLREEIEVGEDALTRGLQRLWQERLRRWRNTREHDEIIEVLPWIFWHWQRLGKWYTAMEDKLSHFNRGEYGDYQLISLKTNDMMMGQNMAAYPTSLKLHALPDSLSLVRKVVDSDPLLFLLEGAVAPCKIPSAPDVTTRVQSVAEQLPALSAHLAPAAEALAAQPALDDATVGPLMATVIAVRQEVMNVGNTDALAWPEADNGKADKVFNELNELGRSLEDYQIALQCHNIFEAHLTTLELSLLTDGAPAHGQKK